MRKHVVRWRDTSISVGGRGKTKIMSCDGELGGAGCPGKFTLIDGEVEFAGISGEGGLKVRSPLRMLITDMAAGATPHVGSGPAIITDLKYRIP